MLEIVIPCAGEGRRFREAGYLLPKPFMDVAGKPMIQRVVDSLTPSCPHRFQLLDRALVGKTEGAVDTLLKADLPDDHPVLVANCDQLVDVPADTIVRALEWRAGDAGLLTFTSTNPHHSYVKVDKADRIIEIREKQPISSRAVVGIYWFQSGKLLRTHAERVMGSGQRFNGEFYVSELLREMIADNNWVYAVHVPDEKVHMLGTPEELERYLCRAS